jgi:hypothetical protein
MSHVSQRVAIVYRGAVRRSHEGGRGHSTVDQGDTVTDADWLALALRPVHFLWSNAAVSSERNNESNGNSNGKEASASPQAKPRHDRQSRTDVVTTIGQKGQQHTANHQCKAKQQYTDNQQDTAKQQHIAKQQHVNYRSGVGVSLSAASFPKSQEQSALPHASQRPGTILHPPHESKSTTLRVQGRRWCG